MELKSLGYSEFFENYRIEKQLTGLEVGRITKEHKERYILHDAVQEYDAEITGNLRFTAEDRGDFPAVGDWVAFQKFDNQALIHHVYKRKSMLERLSVGKFGEKQIIATNIDYALIMQAVDRDFNVNRLDRYISICNSGKVEYKVLLNKIDLITEKELKDIVHQIKKRHKNIQVLPVSNETKQGFQDLISIFKHGVSFCIIGSSGVGKSSLINNLLDDDHFMTKEISESTQKGKHTTSHKEMVFLHNGAILIDTPGMRELGMTDSTQAIDDTFADIQQYASQCRFPDCTHSSEPGCAVQTAIAEGIIEQKALDNYLKLEREALRAKSNIAEKRKKEKEFGKMVKSIVKEKKKNKCLFMTRRCLVV